MLARRLIMLALALASAALAVWLSPANAARSGTAPRRASRGRSHVPHRALEPVFGPRAPRPSVSASDAGSAQPSDASGGAALALEAELPMTGVLARDVAARFCPLAARELCTARDRFACGPLSTEEATYPEDEPPLSCVERMSFACEDWAWRTYAAAPDILILDDAAVAPCLEHLASDATAGLDVVSLDVGCSDLATNARGVGEACEASWYRCYGGDCVERRCVARPREGGPCEEGLCATGLVCVAGLCVPGTPHEGPCDAESVCAERNDECIFGRCVASVPDGSSCVEDVDCAPGSRCDVGHCVRAEETCAYDEECGRGRFCSGMWNARCERLDVGAPCLRARDCDPGLACVGALCVMAPALSPGTRDEDELCDAYGSPLAQCLPGFACVWAVEDGRCLASLCAEPDPFAAFEDSR